MHQVPLVLQAILGLLRSSLGFALLRRNLRRFETRNLEERYRLAWTAVRQFRWLLEGRAHHGNRFRICWRNFVAAKIIRSVLGPGNYPDWLLKVEGGEFANIGSSQITVPLVVGIHSRNSDAIMAALRHLGLNPVMVRQGPVEAVLPSGNLLADPDVLIRIRKTLREGRPVLALADFTRRRPGTLYHDQYLSSALFEAGNRIGAPVIFAAVSVGMDGRVCVVFQPSASHVQRNLNLEEVQKTFRQFIGQTTGTAAAWTDVRSQSDILFLPRQFNDFALSPPT